MKIIEKTDKMRQNLLCIWQNWLPFWFYYGLYAY